jgi:hypothetical protein
VASASEGSKAAAEALFNEGRSLMAAQRYDEAIAKFKASQNLDPALGTMLNLASCYERTGKIASAWAQYREVVSLARQSGEKEREDFAEQKSRELEPKISKLAIKLSAAAGDPSTMTITRDGDVVSAAELAVPIPVDPGKHVIEVRAPGKAPWSLTVEIGEGSTTKAVEIPALMDATGTPPPPPGGTGPAPASKNDGSTQRVVALVTGGVGVVGIGLGTFFGVKASSTWSDAKGECKAYPYDCGAKGVSLQSDAHTQATISTVAFIVGGAALAGGVVLWFTSGPPKQGAASLTLHPGSVDFRGSF